MKSPLEQFKLKLIYRIYNNFIDISITNSSIIILISIIFIIFTTNYNNKILYYNSSKEFSQESKVSKLNIKNQEILQSVLEKNKKIWIKGWSEIIIEKLYSLFEEMLNTQNKEVKKYIPIIYSLFYFILFNNILGLIPYSFTTTSHIIINITMSLVIIIGITIIGFKKYSIKFFKLFIPSGLSKGSTKYIIPLIFIIEFISYLSRIISLSVRLTANMLSGHILLNLISSYGYKLILLLPINTIIITTGLGKLLINICYNNLLIIPIIILIPFILLELGIAFIQSYVFAVLTSAYIKDVIHLH